MALDDAIASDIKLNNVMVNSEGHLRLCDFGFARFLEKEELAYTLVGTPEYVLFSVNVASFIAHEM